MSDKKAAKKLTVVVGVQEFNEEAKKLFNERMDKIAELKGTVKDNVAAYFELARSLLKLQQIEADAKPQLHIRDSDLVYVMEALIKANVVCGADKSDFAKMFSEPDNSLLLQLTDAFYQRVLSFEASGVVSSTPGLNYEEAVVIMIMLNLQNPPDQLKIRKMTELCLKYGPQAITALQTHINDCIEHIGPMSDILPSFDPHYQAIIKQSRAKMDLDTMYAVIRQLQEISVDKGEQLRELQEATNAYVRYQNTMLSGQ